MGVQPRFQPRSPSPAALLSRVPVVVAVPSAEAARELYHAERYVPFRRARVEELASHTTLGIFPALD
jgi:uncharacterized protein (DUF1330 family)